MDKTTFRLDHPDIRLNDSKVFRDAVHGYITVNHMPLWRLINTPAFQRLRRIKQLGGTYIVFPTAEHSRFTHSLGVYQIVREMLESEEVMRCDLSDYDKLTVMCAALLHDIGHGPLSHSFESALGTFNHEDMSRRIICEDEDIVRILSAVDPDLPKDVAAVIAKTHPKRILAQMVSSQIDADRMDYLLRDSHFCGVTYGEFDKARILRTMRVIDGEMVFKTSGVQAIEDYILARYYMYWQVYLHPTARAYEHIFEMIIRRVKDLYQEGYAFKVDVSLLEPLLSGQKVDVKDYLAIDEPMIMHMIAMMDREDDAVLRDLSDRLMNRRLFKHVSLEGHGMYEKACELSDARGLDPRYYVLCDETTQEPYRSDELGFKDTQEIMIYNDNTHTLSPLSAESEIVKALQDGKPKRDAQLFADKRVLQEMMK